MQRWNAFSKLTPRQQRRMRNSLKRFRDLPADKRQALRRQFQGMNAKERARALQQMQRRAQQLRQQQQHRDRRRPG